MTAITLSFGIYILKEDIKMLGVMNGEELAEHRESWREIVEAAMGLNSLE
jgi:hypothetical protein